MRTARVSDFKNSAISSMIQMETHNSVLKTFINGKSKHEASGFDNFLDRMNPMYYYLQCEKAKVIYDCEAESQRNLAMNTMQSVMEGTLMLLVLKTNKLNSNDKERANLLKAIRAILPSKSVSTLFPDLFKMLKTKCTSDSNADPDILNIMNMRIADLTITQLQAIRSNLSPLSNKELVEIQHLYIDSGVQLLGWKGDTQQVSSSSLLKQYEGILVLGDNMKAHFCLGKQYDRLLVGILNSPASKLRSGKEKEHINKSSNVCTLRCRLVLHLSRMLAVARSNVPERAKKCNEIINGTEKHVARDIKVSIGEIKTQMMSFTEILLKLCNIMPQKQIKSLSVSKDFSRLVDIGNSCQIMIPIQKSLIPSVSSFQFDDSFLKIGIQSSKNYYLANYGKDASEKLFSRKGSNSGYNTQTDENSQSPDSISGFGITSEYTPFPHLIPFVSGFCDEIIVMSSLQRPKKITIKGNDGKLYPFLCKPKDDLRKDSRLMELNSMINQFLSDNSESKKRGLKIQTYAVVPLNEECGIIQWVPNTVSFQHVVLGMYRESNNYISVSTIAHLLQTKSKNPGQHFVDNVLKKYPPKFYKWFLKKFNKPEEWFNSKNAFARSAAVMSMVGYIIGLGDRHCENILLDETTGNVVHVDFSCLFEKGMTLEVPEIVPFRLTHNMVDAMGPSGYEGLFRKACEITMNLLRTHRETLMSILDAFVHDPLVEWSTIKTRSKTISNVNSKDLAGDALGTIRGKLAGLFNNAHLSVTGQVDELIKEATNPSKLCKMYIGWAPYI
ncbi:hypothetical protein BB560_002471 [Smittium megazygosporum]|uniref:non-specific serine/threonine protein kinase n=1 Tax=Smittium megazygosporum TaxID=133381 RepID=A0A2T9ZEN8_9FUNG|nr:hypothetical protein BB560_002471 [Smittium megazygosporum]